MTENESERGSGEVESTILASNPRVLLDRQAQQLAYYDAVPREAVFGPTAMPMLAEEEISREQLPRQLVQLVEDYESAHRGEQLRPVRLLQFDGRYPTRNSVSPEPGPDLDQLATVSVTESIVTSEELTVRSYLLFAQRERSG